MGTIRRYNGVQRVTRGTAEASVEIGEGLE